VRHPFYDYTERLARRAIALVGRRLRSFVRKQTITRNRNQRLCPFQKPGTAAGE